MVLHSSSWTECSSEISFSYFFKEVSDLNSHPGRDLRPLEPPVKQNRVKQNRGIRRVTKWNRLGSVKVLPAAMFCAGGLQWQLSPSSPCPGDPFTPLRGICILKSSWPPIKTHRHTPKKTQGRNINSGDCVWLYGIGGGFCSLCFYLLSSVFVTSYIKLHCTTSPTRGHVNKLSRPQTVSLRRTSRCLSPLRQWGRKG